MAALGKIASHDDCHGELQRPSLYVYLLTDMYVCQSRFQRAAQPFTH